MKCIPRRLAQLTIFCLVTVSAQAIVGCYQYIPYTYTKGVKIDESLVAKIERGKTTRADVLKWFGTPSRILTYEPKVTSVGASKETVAGSTVRGELSVTANQEVYIWEYEVKKSVETMMALRAYVGTEVHEAKDSLTVFINRETGIVEDFGFRRETQKI